MSHYGDNNDDHGYYGHHDSHARSWSPDRYSGNSGPRIPPPSQFEPHTPFYAPPMPGPGPRGTLQVPPGYHRPRSVPPPGSRPRSSRRDSYPSEGESDSDSHRHRPNSPLSKAKHVLEHSFSSSTSGLGVGVLGAIVGGLAAREASEAAGKKGGHHHDKNNKGALISTIVGAAVGGLGANAIEKRLEMSRQKTKGEQEAWERKWGEGPQAGRKRDGDRDRERELRDVEEGRGRSGRRGSREYTSGEDSEWEGERRRPVVRTKSYERRY
ncbi:hypothetical protein B0T16DRAFT_243631 [Cercophora newfieldiana]|uniref:Glycine zipper 2TM domain-containing protein n=1 Tax=Cercophora newfieldiana TaxID=92897 RepID=A0AA39XU10_9PEZI|nr:hypothetical protein B0T16DRAFT_243631 [Cercophora newfieldiana]